MAVIARTNESDIQNGNTINSAPLNNEFDNLLNESNSKETRMVNLESNNMTINGIKTFGSIPVLPASDPTTSNQAARKAYVDSVAGSVLKGLQPSYTSAAQITLSAGKLRDSTNAVFITAASPLTIDLTASGAGGLDNGAEGSNTWYYVYVIMKSDSTGVAGMFSTVNEAVSGSITLPAAYVGGYKKQLPWAVRNDGSSNLIPFDTMFWLSETPYCRWRVPKTYFDAGYGLGTTNVLNAGTAGSYTSVACSSYVPPISRVAKLTSQSASANTYYTVRDSVSLNDVHAANTSASVDFDMYLTSGQAVEYKYTAGTNSGLYLDVSGFYVTSFTL